MTGSLLHTLTYPDSPSLWRGAGGDGLGLVLDPFSTTPHPLCRLAAEQLTAYIDQQEEWREEMKSGKMFGVLIVETPEDSHSTHHPSPTTHHPSPITLHYLAAYSGQILGRSDWEGFVPPVFDYLQPDGYFKTEERAISDLSLRIAELKTSPERQRLRREYTECQQRQQDDLTRWQAVMDASKMLRQQRRQEAHLSEQEKEELIRESQYQKAELRRRRQRYAEELNRLQYPLRELNDEIATVERERKDRSRALQRWLFSQFQMLNERGETRTLLDIFSDTVMQIPPSGAGECCEPKLLQYAFAHGLKPLAIATFWYGGHPESELRRHGQFYPACSGKCKPILKWMLGGAWSVKCGVRSEDRGEGQEVRNDVIPPVLYEDSVLLVISKPAGLLTVPGIETDYSVYSIFRRRYPDLDSPLIVHRLDQATSGLLVLAKTREAYVALQRQFMDRTIEKRYVAIVEWAPTTHHPSPTTHHPSPTTHHPSPITLPLRPDYFDRPRQLVDREHGRKAVTHYRITAVTNGRARVELHPLTGRTHQLRVHCAHPDGLNAPIVGDELYGTRADRMYLHAEYLAFTHPVTGERMSFESKAPF